MKLKHPLFPANKNWLVNKYGERNNQPMVVDVSTIALFNASIPGSGNVSKSIVWLRKIESILLGPVPFTVNFDKDIFQVISGRAKGFKSFTIFERSMSSQRIIDSSNSHHFVCASSTERQQLILKLLHCLNEMGRAPKMGLELCQYEVRAMKHHKSDTLCIDIETGKHSKVKRRRHTMSSLYKRGRHHHLSREQRRQTELCVRNEDSLNHDLEERREKVVSIVPDTIPFVLNELYQNESMSTAEGIRIGKVSFDNTQKSYTSFPYKAVVKEGRYWTIYPLTLLALVISIVDLFRSRQFKQHVSQRLRLNNNSWMRNAYGFTQNEWTGTPRIQLDTNEEAIQESDDKNAIINDIANLCIGFLAARSSWIVLCCFLNFFGVHL